MSKYWKLFYETKNFLALDVINIDDAVGKYWDLRDSSNNLHSNISLRNASMVDTIKKNLTGNNTVFVVTGALHTPPHEMAWALKHWDSATKNTARAAGFYHGAPAMEDKFFHYCQTNNLDTSLSGNGSTKVIHEYLKGEKFAILIPKNSKGSQRLADYYPTSPR